MKLILSLFLISMTFGVSASTETTTGIENKKDASVITVIDYDRGKKKNRHNKRINKKRKRKCSQWARKSYAG